MTNRVLAARSVGRGPVRATGRPDRLLIRDLVLRTRIGIHPHEREPQRVRINAEIEIRGDGHPHNDDIAGVLSYEGLIAQIKELTSAGHINLVETLAAKIAEICLIDPRALSVRVRIEKLDVEPDAGAVGIEIERMR